MSSGSDFSKGKTSGPEGPYAGVSSFRRLTHMPSCLGKYYRGRDEVHRLPSTGKIVVSAEMTRIFGSTRYHLAKQVPSCLTLCGMGSRSLNNTESLTAVLQMGFPLEGLKAGVPEDVWYNRLEHVEVIDHDDGSVSLVRSMVDEEYLPKQRGESYSVEGSEQPWEVSHSDSQGAVDIDPNLAQCILDEYDAIRVKCSDYFETYRAKSLADELGLPAPKIVEWNADVTRLQDTLPVWLLLEGGYTGSRPIEFSRIKDAKLREFVIFEHTFWGRKITQLCKDKTADNRERIFARDLKKRLVSFLSCGRDPEFSGSDHDALMVGNTTSTVQHRCERLLECLKTVDGVFIQRFLADPAEVWTWDRFDMFTLGNIWCLLTDEFLDGELRPCALELVSNYSALKGLRKFFKLQGHTAREDLMPGKLTHPWLFQFRFPAKRFQKLKGDVRVQVLSILSQTRGAGTPPPIVALQSKAKCLRLLSTEPAPITEDDWALIRLASDSLLKEITDEALTGLATAARVRITTNACYEQSVKDGGTLEAVNELVFLGRAGRKVKILNLETGATESFVTMDETTVGEYVFWRSLEEVLSLPPDKLRKLRLVMVAEPGKSRAVTMGSACLKVVLDVIHRLMAKPFAKAFPSSTSGMEKSNHGWNVFRDFFTEPLSKIVFNPKKEVRNESRGTLYRDITWETVFCSSTDWNTATDLMLHESADYLAGRLMTKVGIPPLLRGIVHETCFKPRYLEFSASGLLEAFGQPLSEGKRVIKVVRGVMMGDPLTKLLLHMFNMCTRRIAVLLSSVGKTRLDNAVELAHVITALTAT